MRDFDKTKVSKLTQDEFESLREGEAGARVVDKIIHNMAI